MIELVASAISGGDVLPSHLVMARIAIEAMLNPTALMRRIGAEFFDEDTAAGNDIAAMMVYTSMIGAALAGHCGRTLSAPNTDYTTVPEYSGSGERGTI